MIRQPAVAGQFYPGRPEALREEVRKHLDAKAHPEEAIACVCPHAGYMFSGDVAGAVLSSVVIPKTVIVLSFAHRSYSRKNAVWPDGSWRTPLGDVPVDAALVETLLKASPHLAADVDTFSGEHSGEVMLPFLQVLRPDVSVVMISVFAFSGLSDLQALGREMASALKDEDPRPLLVASTDMTHQEPADLAEKRDRLAIDAMLRLDEAGLYTIVRDREISMCGVSAVTATIACAKALGAKSAKLVRYENSGKATGDYDAVVGYAGLAFR